MREQGDLRIIGAGTPGAVPTIAEPIPDFAYVSLSVFAAARIQEWLLFDPQDAGRFTLCGHTFRVLSWADAERALLVAYSGPAPA